MKNFLLLTVIVIFISISHTPYSQSPTAEKLKKIENSDRYKEIVHVWNDLAFVYFNIDSDSAKIALDLAFELANEKKYITGIARTLIGYGYYEITQDNYPKCIKYLDEALEFYNQTDEKIVFDPAYNAYGIAYQAVAEYDKALEYYQKFLRQHD